MSSPVAEIINGVPVPAVKGLVSAVKSDPAKGQTQWNAVTRWKGGFECESKIRNHTVLMNDPNAQGDHRIGLNSPEACGTRRSFFPSPPAEGWCAARRRPKKGTRRRSMRETPLATGQRP